ncbi:MAG: GGDEF domain-containing protein [Candidatus Devosia phytovorans]|uniref:diguanylate cyclase n=1 Tax=Candidatus Devosia phytovorans TaxID=3121372 RepID=A0AAJ6B067_9HYPH|nr:GGDEF domain-containing protein [Devosia sp.]WEK04897.1 MAG: GGDEF domain-containing protein [Devosia sp.]
MMPSKNSTALQNWSGVGLWTLFGTVTCLIVCLAFNTALFIDLGGQALQRALVAATILPIILAVPFFIYTGLRMRGLTRSNLRLGLVARTDSLTACLNRGAFTAKVGTMLSRRNRGALLMIDADNFKSINDVYGHDAGDEALTIIARAIRATLRSGDLVGRMGGEEFGVYLPEVDQRSAELIAERIRRAVNQARFMPTGEQRPLSVSVGAVVFDRPASFSELFRIADQRLYGAKKSGRNRVTMAHLNDHPMIALKRSA